MKKTYTLRLTTLSDTIFGSGQSIPGGEDIALWTDADGYPYLRGSTLKGLLRESCQNWLAWLGEDETTLNLLFGAEGWDSSQTARHISLTGLSLVNRPTDPESCCVYRSFTALADGLAKEGSLRRAKCVASNQIFEGTLYCQPEDEDFLRQLCTLTKWVGTLRNRGFGRVKLELLPTTVQTEDRNEPATLPPCHCIHYRLHTRAPLLVGDASRSDAFTTETQTCVMGSTLRGMVVNALSEQNPTWFADHKEELLGDGVRFLPALPVLGERATLPTLLGFYEDKQEAHFESILLGEMTPGNKRAKLGRYCALNGNTIQFWSPQTGGMTRFLKREKTSKTELFQVRYLEPEQDLEGYILLDNPDLAPHIATAFPQKVWLGADRHAGFGLCEVTTLEEANCPNWVTQYGSDPLEREFCLLVLSPTVMLNEWGEACGLDEAELARLLGVDWVKIGRCSTTVGEYSAYNSTLQCNSGQYACYLPGSLFRLTASAPPDAAHCADLYHRGVGVFTAEGCGQLLLLSMKRYQALTKKQKLSPVPNPTEKAKAELRREEIRWIEAHLPALATIKLSQSQLGDIQRLCEQGIAKGNTDDLTAHLQKNRQERGGRQAALFEEVERLMQTVLTEQDNRTQAQKLALLVKLFDHSRKRKGGITHV